MRSSKDAILNTLLERTRNYNARLPPGGSKVVFTACQLEVDMPLLLNLRGAPLACIEPLVEFEAVNAHFSAQVHDFFNALHDLEDMAEKPSSDNMELLRRDECLWPDIRILKQAFGNPEYGPDDYLHRVYHSRRLTVHNPDSLPLLNRATN